MKASRWKAAQRAKEEETNTKAIKKTRGNTRGHEQPWASHAQQRRQPKKVSEIKEN